MKTNKWKVVSIILLIAVIVLSFMSYQNNNYELGEFKIKKSTLNEISEVNNNEPFDLCNVEKGCIRIGKINQ